MKCPKCGYQSFNDLAACKKCGRDLTEIQAKFNLGSPVPPPSPTAPTKAAETSLETQGADTLPTAGETAAAQDDEQVLEAFFQSIDTPGHDQVPLPAATEQQPLEEVDAAREPGRQVPHTVPEWGQPLPQSEFPFDELDADLEALQQAGSDQQSATAASPFDDVEDFAIDWQLPGEEQVASQPKQPAAASEGLAPQTASGPSLSHPADAGQDLLPSGAAIASEEQSAEESAAAEPAPLNLTGPEPEPEPTQDEVPLAAAPISAQQPAEPEWPMPELPADQRAEDPFAQGDGCSFPEPAAEETERTGLATIIHQTARQFAATLSNIVRRTARQVGATFSNIRTRAAGFSFRLAKAAPLRQAAGEPEPAPEQAAAEAPSRPAQPPGPQGELPFANEETEPMGQPATIAGVLLPDGERDPIGAGARLLALRAKAYLVDLAVLATLFALFVCAGEIARLPGSAQRFRFTGDVLLDLSAPYFLVLFSLCFGYFTLFHYLSGQTPGKMLFNVRVEGDGHASLTLAQAFLRCVGGLISLLPAGLGFLLVVLDGEQRGWNDRLAGSQVVMVNGRDDD